MERFYVGEGIETKSYAEALAGTRREKGGEATAKRCESPIEAAWERLCTASKRLIEGLDVLEKRLSWVLAPELPKDTTTQEVKGPPSLLLQRLSELEAVLDLQGCRVQRLLDRLTL